MSIIHTHENVQIRRGPWTVEEDSILVHYTARYGEGRWNHLAKSSGNRFYLALCSLYFFVHDFLCPFT